ncbi:MAG: DUF3800 domain-containing protein [Candidatus Aenigmarchaeota archaeon]|nr:DUF3800 domain-containing protein [Candidatus Aenigmarchaeota archaeon]
MEFACFDESGDIGKDGTKYIVLGLMCTNEIHKVRNAIRWAKTQMLRHNKTARWLNRNGGEIKFYNFPDKELMKRILKKLSEIKISFYVMPFKKGDGTNIDKNQILGMLLMHVTIFSKGRVPEYIIADTQFFNSKKENKLIAFIKHGQNQISYKMINENESRENITDDFKEAFRLRILHNNSKVREELQATDLMCGSVFQLFERNNEEFVECLKHNKLNLVIAEKVKIEK